MKIGTRTVLFLVFAVALTHGAATAQAQEQNPAGAVARPAAVPDGPGEAVTLRNVLKATRYDPADSGPLLVIAPDQPLADGGSELQSGSSRQVSVPTFARLFQRKVVNIGSITVLAPTKMKVIETNPGKANPLAGMSPAEILKLLIGSFTSEQWQIAAGESGIGLGDLTGEQAPLFDRLLPSKIRVQKSTVADGAGSGAITFKNVQTIEVADRASVRLRFNREVSIALHGKGVSGVYMGGNSLDYHPGDTVVQLLPSRTYGSDSDTDDAMSTAFGVLLLKTAANRQKPSELDYAAQTLDARVSLRGFDTKATVGQLIARVAAATRLRLVADYRVRDLSVYVAGAEARAGDILQAVALGVTGTFRRVGAPPTFLLTDDIAGIGARVTRLEFWAWQAQQERFRLLLDAGARAVKQDPLGQLKFGAGDKLALTPDAQKKIDDSYRAGQDVEIAEQNSADLPPEIRKEVGRDIDAWRTQENVVLDPARVTIGMQLSTCFVIPDIGTVKDVFASLSAGPMNLRDLAAAPAAPTKPAEKGTATAIAAWLAPTTSRHILLVAPKSPVEAALLVSDAAARGFNEVWIRVALDGSADAAATVHAVQSAQKLPVVAVVSLLHGGGMPGTPELTILGQTGAEFAADYISGKSTAPTSKGVVTPDVLNQRVLQHYSDWVEADRVELARQLETIAATPGLAGLAIEGVTPPGFTKPVNDYGEFVLPGGAFGYTEKRRMSLIESRNLDPIDVRGATLALASVNLALPFFPDSGSSSGSSDTGSPAIGFDTVSSPRLIRDTFLFTGNDELLRTVFNTVRAARPNLPLYIDDRVSDFVSANTSWFGSWDNPFNLPKNDVYGDPGVAPKMARLTSKTALLWETVPDLDSSADPCALATLLSTASLKAADQWNGLVVDFTNIPATRVSELLDTLKRTGK